MPHTLLYCGKLREYMCDTCSEGICEDVTNRTVHRDCHNSRQGGA